MKTTDSEAYLPDTFLYCDPYSRSTVLGVGRVLWHVKGSRAPSPHSEGIVFSGGGPLYSNRGDYYAYTYWVGFPDYLGAPCFEEYAHIKVPPIID